MERLAEAKNTLDAVLVSGGVTAPFWVGYIQTGASITLALGGVVLLALRIAIAVRELRAKKIDRP